MFEESETCYSKRYPLEEPTEAVVGAGDGKKQRFWRSEDGAGLKLCGRRESSMLGVRIRSRVEAEDAVDEHALVSLSQLAVASQ